MASPFIEFQVQIAGSDTPKTFNAYTIGVIEPLDGDTQCNIYYSGQSYTVEGSYASVVAALEALFP